MKRSAGILLPITALPSPWGVGTLGGAAREFLDFLQQSGQSYWQILPICPTGYGDSPYQSFSSFAGNPYHIDLDDLAAEGLLRREEYAGISWESRPGRVDYGLLYRRRGKVLRLAADRLLEREEPAFAAFCAGQADWLEDYALFMAIKEENGGAPWSQWPAPLRLREPEAMRLAARRLAGQRDYWKAVQYLFFCQWDRLKADACRRGIALIGDLPIYVALDSADVWADPAQFQLDGQLRPVWVAGCPPDGFSATGQLWGNPLFAWDRMEREGYRWWIRRIARQL